MSKRIWVMFVFLCFNVAILNVTAGYDVFVFMPALATLSSFAFTVMTSLISRRFMSAGIVLFVTGILMAQYPMHVFLIYGLGWLLVLQSLGVVFWLKRGRYRDLDPPDEWSGEPSDLQTAAQAPSTQV
jgi:hypothetical protein